MLHAERCTLQAALSRPYTLSLYKMTTFSSIRRILEDAAAASAASVSEKTPGYVDPSTAEETLFEQYSDYIVGFAYLLTAAVAAKRMSANRQQTNTTGAETTVVTAFYSLILTTAFFRCLYFLIPASIWQPSYTPVAVKAWDPDHPSWVGYTFAELTVTAGSLTLFSIFILILVYWADILKKYYNPGSRRTLPMATFLALVATLTTTEVVNIVMFLLGYYTTEGMILFNAVLLAVTSTICVAEITIFSRKFQNVLKTLGAINQVSTDSQVRRIVWITVTGNMFFVTRAILESIFAGYLGVYWWKHGTVDRAFSHAFWDVYTLVKYLSELTILALMLHILQSRFSASATGGAAASSSASSEAPSQSNKAGYMKVPEAASIDV